MSNPTRRLAVLSASVAALANGASTTGGTAQIVKPDFPTLVTHLTGEVISAGVVVDSPNVKINIKLGANRNKVVRADVPWRSLIGTARQPFALPEPFELGANEEAEVTFTNNQGAAIDAYVNLIGSRPA